MAQQTSKKKKILTSALAVALAAVMLMGGTYAYLQDETDEVTNNFKTNDVFVDLDETTGSDYNIIPGTEQAKDPKVTVDNTVDAYVYVEITDNTDGLVTYEIADGWTLVDGFTNVYYREVAADADVKEFSVLKDDKVIYDAALENSDMVDENGNLKADVALTFKAYAIQKEPFNDPAVACPLTSVDALGDAIANAEAGDVITVTGGTVTEALTIDKSITVKNLNAAAPVTVNASDVVLDNAVISVDTAKTPAITVPKTVENFTLTNSTISADTGSAGTHTAVNIAAGGEIVITGNTITNTTYNGVELTQNTASPVTSATISGNTFVDCGNNAISAYAFADGAVVNIENNTFTNVSNAIRISDYSNAAVTLNVTNNVANTDAMWENAFVLLQAVKGEDFSNVTINFSGNTLDEAGVYTYVYGSTTAPVVNHI